MQRTERNRSSDPYDGKGRLLTITHGDGTAMHYSYDVANRISSLRDENHSTPNTVYRYDPAGRLSEAEQTLASVSGGTITTRYAYDLAGNLTSVTDPNGNVTTYVYDDFAQMLAQDSPVTGLTTYAYDDGGNRVRSTDANGAVTEREYDSLGRVLVATSIRSGDAETVTWTYDDATAGQHGIGRLATMQDPSGETNYSYDRRGLLTSQVNDDFALAFGYDADGNRSRIVYPSGRVADYTFDFANRPVSVSVAGTPVVTSAAYLPFGPATSMVFGNGTLRTTTYDSRYRLSRNTLSAANSALVDYVYQYDPAGNVLQLHDQVSPGYNRNFAYDGLNRLTGAGTGSSLWGNGSYSYDAMGNMLTSTLGSRLTSFTYDGTRPTLSSVVENGTLSQVEYDSAGNEIAARGDGSAYSPRNHLVESGPLGYVYDARGVRVATAYPAHSLASLSLSKSALYPNEAASGTVTLAAPAPAGGVVVKLASSNPGVIVPAEVAVGEGSVTAVFGVTLNGVVAPGATIITATYGLRLTAEVAILEAPTLASLTLTPSSLTGGQSSTGTLVLTGPAPPAGATVLITSSSLSATVPSSVAIEAGTTTASFEVGTAGVAAVTNVAVESHYGNTLSMSLTINAPALTGLTVSPATIMGGEAALGTVTLDGPAPEGGAVVSLSSSVPAIASVPASAVIAAGATNQAFQVTAGFPSTEVAATITGDYNSSASAVLVVQPCALSHAQAPILPAGDWVWIDDSAPAGSTVYAGSVWDTTQQASGAQSLTRPPQSGDNVLGITNAAATLPLTFGESVFFYALVNECAPPGRIMVQWLTSDGASHYAHWGEAMNNSLARGPLPAPGSWQRLEVPASLLNMEAKTVTGVYFYMNGGQVWIDRVGKSGVGCTPAIAPPPTLSAGDTVWVEDQPPAGASVYDGTGWDMSQKASGSQSITRPFQPGDSVLGFSNATAALPVAYGESVFFYALVNECAPPSRILVQWVTSDGASHYAHWGQAMNNSLARGPLPAPGSWQRLEVPASLLNMEAKTVTGVYFHMNGGQVWIDRVGKGGVGCTPAIAPPPTLSAGDTVWVEDEPPAGASVYGGTGWDVSQKASGDQSFTRPFQPGDNVLGFSNATAALPVTYGESVFFYALVNECAPPGRIMVQWITSDGASHYAHWGEAMNNSLARGPLPEPGSWQRLEVPASLLNMEAKTVTGVYFYMNGGQVWIDRVGKSGVGCTPAIAPPPTLSAGDTVWVEDEPPAGASVYDGTGWDVSQKASGSQSITRPFQPGDNVLGFSNATAALPVAYAESIFFYALVNECAPPGRIMVQWLTSDGAAHNAHWGEAMNNSLARGPLPESGSWQRLEVPASLLNMETKTVTGVYFYMNGGQVWIDRVGKATGGGAANAPMMSAASSQSLSSLRRYSVYGPDLQLMAETEPTTAVTPAIAHEYVWFGGQPIAQIFTGTGEVAWYFNDHLGTPILQTDATATTIWRIEREPYGKPFTVRAGATRHQPLAFPGQEDDGGISYNIFRWYRAEWGRYTQSDPDQYNAPFHPYDYSNGNPQRWSDPRGLKAFNMFEIPPNLPSMTGPLPDKKCCSQQAIQKATDSVDYQIDRLLQGKMPAGTVVAMTISPTICSNGLCSNYPVDPKEYVFDNEYSKDPCVNYCINFHEFLHFTDTRQWDMSWSHTQITQFNEFFPYLGEKACLKHFGGK